MFVKKYLKSKPVRGFKAQAIIEFAIVLPILLMVVIGLLEVGRYLFIYSAATNASRNAVRYASAVGRDDAQGLTKYNYCWGIKQSALDSAYLINPSTIGVQIFYDNGMGTSLGQCSVWNVTQVDTSITVSSGNRVRVVVTIPYKPMVNLVPIKARTITSASARTILGIRDIK